MQDAVIVAGGRAPVARGRVGGTYYFDKPEAISAQVLKGVLKQLGPRFSPVEIDDVIVGCAMPENIQGSNIARRLTLEAGLPVSVPAQTINRYCASGIEALALADLKVKSGQANLVVAGGLEFQSTTPYASLEATASLPLEEAGVGLSTWMGITAENLAEAYEISRQAQDEFSVGSHHKAAKNRAALEGETIPVEAHTGEGDDTHWVTHDEGIRPDTSLAQVAKLPAVFKKGGTVTAASSSQISDGTGFIVVMSRDLAKQWGLKPLGRLLDYQVVGCDPDMMGIGPVPATQKVLQNTGLILDDMGVIELNEAFAAQSLAVCQALDLDPKRINPRGGAIALGHPNGATGAILSWRLLDEMKQKQARYGLVTMCIGGGMGAAGIFERCCEEETGNGNL